MRYDLSAPGLSCVSGRKMIEVRNGSAVKLRAYWVPPGWRPGTPAEGYVLGEVSQGVSRFPISSEGVLYWHAANMQVIATPEARLITSHQVCEVPTGTREG